MKMRHIWRPVFRHLSSILLSTCVIIGPQKATLPSQMDIICCRNTSSNSGIGQPRYFSLLNIHILWKARLQIYSVLEIVFKSDLRIFPRIFCSSTTSIFEPTSVEICGEISYFFNGLKIIAFVFRGFNNIFLSELRLTTF